jgi:hypothetical protein
MSKECNDSYVSKGTFTPLSNHDNNLNDVDDKSAPRSCCVLVPSWTGHGIFSCNWIDASGTCKRKRHIEHHDSNNCISRRRPATDLDKIIHEIRQCDVCARDMLWTPSQHQCFSGALSSLKSISESLPRFIELHISCPSPLPCSFCTRKGSKLPWCGSLYCSRTCQIRAEDGISTPIAATSTASFPNLPPPKLYFCRNRFWSGGTDSNDGHLDLVNEVINSLLAIEKRLHTVCGYDASDPESPIQIFHSEECALLLTTIIACLCPDWIHAHLDRASNDGAPVSSEDIDANEASLVEEFWAMSRTHRSVFNLLQKCNDPKGSTITTSFPSYNEFLQCYLDIKRSCILRVDASSHPLLAYATKTIMSSLELSESERETALGVLLHGTDLATITEFNNDPIQRWRNAAHLAYWFSQSSSTNESASRGIQTHLQKSYFAFSSTLFRRVYHSCVPTVALTRTNDLAWLALHNYTKEELTTSKLDSLEGDLQVRSTELKRILGQNFVCSCVRCRYEAAPNNIICLGFSREQLKRVGDLAMQQGRFEDAFTMYDSILLSHPHDGDILHARAAAILGRASSVEFAKLGHCQGYFTHAQRLWSEAGVLSSTHPDIAIQLEKQVVYKTLQYDVHADTDVNIPYTSFLDGKCHITAVPVISLEGCQRVINTAENYSATGGNGGWTTSRHYAVPTTDVPIQELKDLHGWFYKIWNGTIRPLLRAQFKLTSTAASGKRTRDVFVHDAFVVRYDAEKQRSLPPHYDESTHSFIIALNSEFKGGGTFIDSLGKSITPSPGGMLSFCGGELKHSGNPVVEGVRYIIAAFCYADLYGAGISALNGNRNQSKLKDLFKEAEFSFGFSA